MCSPLTDMVLLKVSCLFVHCVLCNRRRRDLLRIVRLSGARYKGRRRERLCVSGLRSPQLSAQLRRPNYSTSYSQRYGEEVTMVPRPRRFWCVEDGGCGVCSSDMHHLVQKPVSVAQMQFTHATRSPRARQLAGKVVCGSKVDIAVGVSTRDSAATEKSFL